MNQLHGHHCFPEDVHIFFLHIPRRPLANVKALVFKRCRLLSWQVDLQHCFFFPPAALKWVILNGILNALNHIEPTG